MEGNESFCLVDFQVKFVIKNSNSINRTRMTQIELVHTDLILTNPFDPFNPCSIGGMSNCICFSLSWKSFNPSFHGSGSFCHWNLHLLFVILWEKS